MKTDLDRLMEQRNLDAIVVFGPDGVADVNAHMNYFTGGRFLIGLIFKKRNEPTHLIHGAMERDDAQATGLSLIEYSRWPMRQIQASASSPFAARVELHRQIFQDLGLTGRVGVYGVGELSEFHALLLRLGEVVPGLSIVSEGFRSLLAEARETKDEHEVAAMEEVGKRTCDVVNRTRQFLQERRVAGNRLMNPSGQPITIGEVRRHVKGLLLDQQLEHPGDFIFAQGRDAGVPHNHGNDCDELQLGTSIIFDIYPRLPRKYFHDMTRTWSLGHATDELLRLHQTVQEAFDLAVTLCKPGVKTFDIQQQICQFFEDRGHSTLRKDPQGHSGYIHGLGHGLGLDVHESPGFPTFADQGGKISPGLVFTIEPGLYYPERGMAVRIEDTYVCDPNGSIRSLTPCCKELVVAVG